MTATTPRGYPRNVRHVQVSVASGENKLTIELLENPALEIIGQNGETEQIASALHGELGSILHWRLADYVYSRGVGKLFIDQTSFKVGGSTPKCQPDVAFVMKEWMAKSIDKEVPFAPDLAVEVISHTDDWSEIAQKARNYLKAGTQIVWAIDPYERNVFVFRPHQLMEMLNIEGELDGGTLLPGFKLPLRELFAVVPLENEDEQIYSY